MDIEEIELIAEKINYAFEDNYVFQDKRKLYTSLFDKYLADVDQGVMTDPYDAVVSLGRKDPEEFNKFVKELKDQNLVSDL